MSRFRRVLDALLSSGEEVPERQEPAIAKTAPVRITESYGTTIDPDEDDWRPLTGSRRRRDLTPISQHRMQELAAYQWESNRLTNRLVELPVAFLLGEGVTLAVDDPQAQEWLDEFWLDPINRLDLKLEKHVRELSLFGEICLPVFVKELTGHVRLGKVDPSAIINVITDPDNVETPIGVVVENRSGHKKVYRIIYDGRDEDLFGQGAINQRRGMTAGDCFFFRVNDLSTGRRGRSDVLSAIDPADQYEQLLFGEGDRADLLRQVSWDVTLKNATADEVKQRATEITPPEPMSVRVHNDNEVWETQTPDLSSLDATTILDAIRKHVLGGNTVPTHWFGGADDVNLATASSMGEPTFKVFSQRQRLWKAILEAVASYVIEQRLLAISSEVVGLRKMPSFKPRAVFPELTARDTSKYTAALQQVVVAVTQAVAGGVMSEETGVKLIAMVAGQLGLEIDPVEELRAARADAARRAENDVYTVPPAVTGEQMSQPNQDALS
jgi:hypothetical protein